MDNCIANLSKKLVHHFFSQAQQRFLSLEHSVIWIELSNCPKQYGLVTMFRLQLQLPSEIKPGATFVRHVF